MVQPLINYYKRKSLYRVTVNSAETNNLRSVHLPGPTKHKAIKPPKKQDVGHVIAMYAFSIFELNRDDVSSSPSFPKHFICSHLLPDEQTKVNNAVKLFHQVKEDNRAARLGKVTVNSVSEYLSEFNNIENEVIAVSKIYRGEQIIFVYNASSTEAKEKFIKLDGLANRSVCQLTALYGYDSCSRVNINRATVNAQDLVYLKLYLKPRHLVILSFP
ncbi:MAG TPA: hypothetical protein VG738_13240 [Chitinophagaceae bacterium]|nr:hypothetical protein [Chitinophagaceae bacterium]